MAARQSTNGIFDGGRSVIHGSLRGHCIRRPSLLSCPSRQTVLRGLIDAALPPVNAKTRERERVRDKQKKEEGRREMAGGGR